MIRKVIISSLFILLTVGVLEFTTTLAVAAPNRVFYDIESPGPVVFNVGTVVLDVGATYLEQTPIKGLTPIGQINLISNIGCLPGFLMSVSRSCKG